TDGDTRTGTVSTAWRSAKHDKYLRQAVRTARWRRNLVTGEILVVVLQHQRIIQRSALGVRKQRRLKEQIAVAQAYLVKAPTMIRPVRLDPLFQVWIGLGVNRQAQGAQHYPHDWQLWRFHFFLSSNLVLVELNSACKC